MALSEVYRSCRLTARRWVGARNLEPVLAPSKARGLLGMPGAGRGCQHATLLVAVRCGFGIIVQFFPGSEQKGRRVQMFRARSDRCFE